MKKVFELHQKITMMVNEYVVLKDAGKDKQKIAGYAKQKRLALREKFTLFTDESQSKIIATSQARKAMDLAPTFDILNEKDKPLGILKKEFKKSLLVSSWLIYDPHMKKVLFTIREKSTTVALGRRVWGFVPFLGELPFPIKFHFSILSNGKVAGEYIKTTLFRDQYALYLNRNQEDKVDERVWMVTAVLLDAMQSR